MSYATVTEIEAGFRVLNSDERAKAEALASEADVLIDAYNENAKESRKKLAECRMVRRALGSGDASFPLGSNQGTVSALGYSQTFSMGGGSTGELYIGKEEKKLLGVSNKVGASNPYDGN